MRRKITIGVCIYLVAMLALGGWLLFSTGFIPSYGLPVGKDQSNLWTGLTQALLEEMATEGGIATGPGSSPPEGSKSGGPVDPSSPGQNGNVSAPGSLIVIPKPNQSTPGLSPGLGSIALTPEMILNLANRVSAADRLVVLNIVRKRFSLGDIRHALSLVQGGVTPAEKAELVNLVKARLSVEDMATIRDLLLKYAA